MLAIINKIFISFIGDDDQIMFFDKISNFANFGAIKNDAGGVLRCRQTEDPRAWCDMGMQSGAQTFKPRAMSIDKYRVAARERNQIFGGRPIWGKEQDLIARIERALESGKKPVH